MRLLTTRILALLALLGMTLAVGTVIALANGEAAAICPAGEVGLTVHWADAQDALFCSVAQGLQGVPASPTIVGLVVRGPDDALSTIDVVPAPAPDVTTRSSVSTSRSISSSSSTTCINGHCTTSTNQTVCVDDSCSSQP
jgi:hypothetical protein